MAVDSNCYTPNRHLDVKAKFIRGVAKELQQYSAVGFDQNGSVNLYLESKGIFGMTKRL